eukprot:1509586-Pyramimonas_sp.AAC.1
MTLMLRFMCSSLFDKFLERNRDVGLASHVDDDTVSAHASPDHVVEVLEKAADDLHRVLREDLGIGLAADKRLTFASSPALSLRIGRRLGTLAGTVGTHVVSLGVDLAPGSKRN